MEQGPSFTKKETETCKLACESMQAGMGSPLETSLPYINMSTARSSMTIPPTSPARSISFCSSMHQQEQRLISSCSPYKPSNSEGNFNPSPNLNPRNTGENQTIKTTASPVYRDADLTFSTTSDCSLSAQQSPASPYPIRNPHPYPSPNPSPCPGPYLSTPDPLLADDRYPSRTLISAKSPSLITNQHQLHEQSLFDQDHQLGLIFSDDQVFGGLRSLPPHASSPLFTEGLQESWLPMITDPPYISIQRQAAAFMSPAPEITGLADLQEAEMSLFSGAITARRWSVYDENSCSRKGLPDRSELPSTTASAMDSGTKKHPPLELLSVPQDSGKDMHRTPPVRDAQDGCPPHSAGISAYSSQKEVASQYANLSTSIIGGQSDYGGSDQSPPHHSTLFSGTYFGGKSTASERGGGAGAGLSGGESEGLKHTYPVTETSSSSASELQDHEDSNTSNQYKPVGAEATHDKLDGDDLGKPAANVDIKSSKKPRKKGQRRVREVRVALLTKSDVEHLEDGYHWRKYGQKAVKNSPHPRSYYRCTHSKCFVKKRVERCNEDPSLVVTTYEGQHTHHSPALLRVCHDMIDPFNTTSPFRPWHNSSLNMHASTHPPSHFSPTSINSTLHQLFRPFNSFPSFLLTKPLPFPTTPLSIPSTLDHANSLARFSMHPHLQSPHHLMPRPQQQSPQHVMQAGVAHAQPCLLSPTHNDNASSRAFPNPLVDKGLLDDMLPHACVRKPSPSSSS